MLVNEIDILLIESEVERDKKKVWSANMNMYSGLWLIFLLKLGVLQNIMQDTKIIRGEVLNITEADQDELTLC